MSIGKNRLLKNKLIITKFFDYIKRSKYKVLWGEINNWSALCQHHRFKEYSMLKSNNEIVKIS